MRVMYDGVNPVGCPFDGEVYAGYVDGDYPSFAGMKARFPGKTYVSITVKVDGIADVLDSESTNPTPEQAAEWVALMRHLDRIPTVYTDLAAVPSVLSWCRAKGVALPVQFWVADWDDNANFPPPIPGATWVATQYDGDHPFNGSRYDKSAAADYWAGVDPKPKPPPAPKPVPVPEDDDMANNMVLYSIDMTDAPDGTATVGIWVHYPNTGIYLHVEGALGLTVNVTSFAKAGAVGPEPITYAQHLGLVAASPNGASS